LSCAGSARLAADFRDVTGRRTLRAIDNIELDLIAFSERLEAAGLNGAEMDVQ